MGTSNSILSYDDIRDALDRAISSPIGVRIVMDNRAKATHLRHRIYKFRHLDRKTSRDIYAEGDRRHNSSIYDVLALEQVEEVITIRKTAAGTLRVEELDS